MQRDTWKRVHGELTRLARSKGAYDAEEARWLLEGKRVRVHEPLGYSTFLSYLEHVFGYGPRLASERLRVAEAIALLPAMNDALASGALCWSSVRELTRVAVPETEAEWIAAARQKSMREVEDMVSGRKSGDRPGDPADPARKREVLRLELTGDGLAAFREARRRIELDVGHSLGASHSAASTSPSPSALRRPGQNAASDLHTGALDALLRLGFSAAQARRALAMSSSAGDIETLLREALMHLRPRVHVSRASEPGQPGPRYGSRARCAASSSRTADRVSAATWSSPLASAGWSMAGADRPRAARLRDRGTIQPVWIAATVALLSPRGSAPDSLCCSHNKVSDPDVGAHDAGSAVGWRSPAGRSTLPT